MPWVRLVDAAGAEVADEDGDPLDGHFLATITADGEYYAKVTSLAMYGGHLLRVHRERPASARRGGCAQGLGGHLVTVNDAAEQAWLDELFYAGEVWIGLSDEAVEGTWAWMSGEPVTYTNWASGQPATGSHDFARIWQGDGQWYDGYSSWDGVGLAELDGGDHRRRGPGPLVAVPAGRDGVGPGAAGGDRGGRPAGRGRTTDKPMNSFTVTFSEDLLAGPRTR